MSPRNRPEAFPGADLSALPPVSGRAGRFGGQGGPPAGRHCAALRRNLPAPPVPRAQPRPAMSAPRADHAPGVSPVPRALVGAGRTDAVTIAKAMEIRPQAPYCSACGQYVGGCSSAATAVICWRCTLAAAEKPGADRPKRHCLECGGPVPPRARYCSSCRRRRRRRAGLRSRTKSETDRAKSA